jgi:Tfp pilus assembly protein PilF
MRNPTYGISFSAAYQLAYGFSKQKEHKKALFYARIACDRAVASGNVEYIAKSYNEIGNCLLAESYFEEAIAEYEKALKLVPGEASVFHVAIFVNLGYCRIVQGELADGFRNLYEALRWCRRHPTANVYEAWAHLALACGFSELRRWCYAWKHGRRGLELAESVGSPDAVKTGLYLMGEIEKSAGDVDAAYHYYSRMQQEFYPDLNNLAGAMLFLETKQLVNLRA